MSEEASERLIKEASRGVDRNAQKKEEEALRKKQQDAEDEDDPHWKDKLNLPEKDKRVKTEDVINTKGISFEDFHLKRNLLKGIFEMGFEAPSPIQGESIPVALLNHHILARAKNGTGKTASYVIPVLEKVDGTQRYTQALILVPTRELALQTSAVVKKMGKHLGVNVVVTTGGTELKDDIIRMMQPVHIIVATPGRILDLCNKRVVRLDKCHTFVMDEADKLLSMEFSECIDRLIDYTPKDRQVRAYVRCVRMQRDAEVLGVGCWVLGFRF